MSNDLSQLWYERAKDSPGKLWWEAEAMHPAIFRSLHINREDPGAVYAVHPFRLARVNDVARILVAYPAPCIFGPPSDDWLDIETVLAWNPVSDKATVLADTEPQLVGRFADTKEGALFAKPYTFFRKWAELRATFAITRQSAAGQQWQTAPTETDLIPGCLMVGAPQAIRWPVRSLPADIAVIGGNANQINSAILKAARIPRAFQRAAA